MLRADLHSHTYRSPDSALSPRTVVAACLRRGINCLAVTDHHRIEGALEVQALVPFRVIVGEEIRSAEGEIIGLFLFERIPRGLSAQETIARIKEQGGLVYVPHPFDTFRRSPLRQEALLTLADQIDILEVFNARNLLPAHNEAALRFAQEHGIVCGAGSDAHTLFELGQAYVEMPEFENQEEFLAALRQGRIVGRLSNPLVHALSGLTRWRKQLSGS